MIAILRALAAAAALAISAQAPAATFGLMPMRVELTAAAPTAIVTVTNSGDAPITIQVKSYVWTQPAGTDVYEETRDFIISPPIFTIAPGGAQVVRVAMRGKPPADVEQAFRLMFREVPPAEETATDRALFRIALNMNIPMFVAPTRGAAAPKGSFTVETGQGASPRLRIANEGTANLRLAGLSVAQGETKLVEQDVFVVLPGATRYVALPEDRVHAGKPVRVEAQSNGGRVDVALPLSKP